MIHSMINAHVFRPLFLCFCALFIFSACAKQVDIVHDLSEFEANEILVVLNSSSIDAQKVKQPGRIVTWLIQVRSSDVGEALELLINNRLPRTPKLGLKEVYPAGGGGMIPTASEEKAKFLMAMQGEIDKKLVSLPRIVDAHTSIVIPDRNVIRDLNAPPTIPSASVAMVYLSDNTGQIPLQVEQIQSIVAAAVEDLQPEHVNVLLQAYIPPQDSTSRSARSTLNDSDVFGIRVLGASSATRAKVMILGSLTLSLGALVFAFVVFYRSLRMKQQLQAIKNRS
jgi:type III secretion protein J